MVIGILPSNLAEHTHYRGVWLSPKVSIIRRNLSDSENYGNQKVISQGLDGGFSSHQILIGQLVCLHGSFPPDLFISYWTWALSP
jgi:hypothetical protein